MPEPHCPYCGARMSIEQQPCALTTFAVQCGRCGARGPLVYGMGDKARLKEKALTRALRREETKRDVQP